MMQALKRFAPDIYAQITKMQSARRNQVKKAKDELCEVIRGYLEKEEKLGIFDALTVCTLVATKAAAWYLTITPVKRWPKNMQKRRDEANG